MKHNTIIITVCFLGFAFLAGCQKESDPDPGQLQSLIPIFNLGDTIRNNIHTSYEKINIMIDSNSQIGFKLTSSHSYVPDQYTTYFIRIEFDYQDDIRFLDSLAFGGYVFAGPIMSTFEYGDTIKPNIADEGIFDWYPKNEGQMGNTGWLKYHIYAGGGGTTQNVTVGENYYVFKFGDAGNEKIGWVNIVYQDTICYIKEGYYDSTTNQEIVVGNK